MDNTQSGKSGFSNSDNCTCDCKSLDKILDSFQAKYNLSVEERKNRIVEMYNSLQKFYSDFLKHKLSNKMIGDFDEKFPNNNISAIKKIDLILWQTRN